MISSARTMQMAFTSAMLEKMLIKQLFLAPAILRSSAQLPAIRHFRLSSSLKYSTGAHNITQPSFWASLVPKPLRKSSASPSALKNSASKQWNPATFYIIIFLLIGSMSIQMIALRNEFNVFSRRADAKIDLLKEVIERVRKGEDVDVEGLLGAGDKEKEKEWEEVLREIEKEDELWAESRRKNPRRVTASGDSALIPQDDKISLTGRDVAVAQENAKPKAKSNAPAGFY